MDKPIHAKPSLYWFYFQIIKEIWLKYWYNIVLHWSMNRDLDLIAVPWQDKIWDKKEMLIEIADLVWWYLVFETDEIREMRKKPHWREVFIINICRDIVFKYNWISCELFNYPDPQYYIDISIIPH